MSTTIASKFPPHWLRLEFDGTTTPVKTTLFLLVCLAWLLPGLTGRDLWKSEEAINFGLVYHILQSGDWVVPSIAGTAYAQQAPLYAMVAALFAKAFGFFLPLHDAARLATGFFVAVSLLCVALAGAALYGPRFGRLSALLLLGSLGLLVRAHEMTPDVAVLASCALGLLGLVRMRASARTGGVLFGAGVGLAFLAGGLLPCLLLLVSALALWSLSSSWRGNDWLLAGGLALLAAIPWLIAWPLALWREAPQLAQQFWQHQWQSLFGFARADHEALYYLRILAWYAWPAIPLVVAYLWSERGRPLVRREELLLPAVALVVFVLLLSLSAERRDGAAMPLLLPLALFAAGCIDHVRRGVASALDWFGIMTFGLFTAALWLAWLAATTGWPQGVADAVAARIPGVAVNFSLARLVVALLLTLVWIAIISHARRSNRRAVVNWAAGITAFWLVLMTLWLPVIDATRSYRPAINELRSILPGNLGCVLGKDLTPAHRSMLDYYLGLRTVNAEFKAQRCRYMIAAARRDLGEVGPEWRLLLEGLRPADRRQIFRLYERR